MIDGYMVPLNVLKTQYDLKDVDSISGLLISKEYIVQDLDLDKKRREIASGRRTVSRATMKPVASCFTQVVYLGETVSQLIPFDKCRWITH